MDLSGLSTSVADFVRQHPNSATLVVFALSTGDWVPFFWPVIIGVASVSAAADPENFWFIVAAAAAGSACGDSLLFWFGHRYHERVGQMWPLRERPLLLERGRLFFRRWGVAAIVVGRFAGPIRASVPIAAGVAEMPWLRFQIANVCSALLTTIVLLSPAVWGMSWLFDALR